MNLIKRTWSIGSRDGKPIAASVVEDGGRVYLLKGKTRTLIEPDAELYALLTRAQRDRQRITHFVVEPTFECNLSCPFCFTNGHVEKFSIGELRAALVPHRGKVVSISGGEPTLVSDLPAIIRLINEKNVALLATNGLRLADRQYVRSLQEAGLRYVTFSLNGFSEQSLIGTTGVGMLEARLRALENLEQAGMQCVLSVLLKRGLNEGEIPALFEYAHAHPSLVREVRIRSTASIGRFAGHRQFFLSEMLELLCERLHLERADILRELKLQKSIGTAVPRISFSMRSCGMGFHLVRSPEGYRTLGACIPEEKGVLALRKTLGALMDMNRPHHLGRGLFRPSAAAPWRHGGQLLKVVLRSWPDKNTIDLFDHHRFCGTRYLTGGKAGQPLCYANILHDIGHALACRTGHMPRVN